MGINGDYALVMDAIGHDCDVAAALSRIVTNALNEGYDDGYRDGKFASADESVTAVRVTELVGSDGVGVPVVEEDWHED
ncbi:MAG: hypothetical protein ACPHJ3_10970 [Rubripirellula sp.]